MENRRRKNQYYGKPKRRDFKFGGNFCPWKSGTNATIDHYGRCLTLGTHQKKKLLIREIKFPQNRVK